ncbi:MAG: TlpA family protein disulfide reductase [Solirubrobacteraceae bacterium]
MASADVSGGAARRIIGARRVAGALIGVALGALLIALLAFGVLAQNPSSSIDGRLARGQAAPAPAFTLAVLQPGRLGAALTRHLAPALARGRVSLHDLSGVPVVLNIWASWCTPCRQEAPTLERTWRRLGRPGGTLFVGLDQQDAAPDARAFLRGYGIDYLNIHDAGNDVPRGYGATGVPETFFLSARGQVVDHLIGVASARELAAGIAAARSGRAITAHTGGAHSSGP